MLIITNRKRLKKEKRESFDRIIRRNLEEMRSYMTAHCTLLCSRTMLGIVALEPKNQATINKLLKGLKCLFQHGNYSEDLYTLLEGDPNNIRHFFEPAETWKEDGQLYIYYNEKIRYQLEQAKEQGLEMVPSYHWKELSKAKQKATIECINDLLPIFGNIAIDWSRKVLTDHEAEALLTSAVSLYRYCPLFRKRCSEISILKKAILSILGPQGDQNRP